MKNIRKNKRGVGITTIIVLIIGIFLLAILLCIIWGSPLCPNPIAKQLKTIAGALAGTDYEENPICEPYRTIQSTQNLTDLIVLVSTGECGGDTTETAFRFNLVGMTSLTLDTQTNLCGTHTYRIRGLNRTITFGDIEKEDVRDCGFSGDSLEWQSCVSDNYNDLIIAVPTETGWALDDCTGYSGIPIWCYNEDPWTTGSHLHKFGLAILSPPNTWAIKRAGEDTVICLVRTD